MEYRLISENCSHSGRSMLSLRVVREIEAVNPEMKLIHMYKMGEDVRMIELRNGSQLRLLFVGCKCVLETPTPLPSVGIGQCNSVGELFTGLHDESEAKRFTLSGFLARMFHAFKK